MRKGFTLSLTVLALLLTASAFAFGPKISAVPDVYITEKTESSSQTDQPSLIFRYSDALVLADYVTPSTGNTYDTVNWAYAIRWANYNGGFDVGTGSLTISWLTAPYVHYQIGDLTYSVPELAKSDPDWGVSQAWADDINQADGTPGNIVGESVADAGSLTFRNIRLNPLPGDTGIPSASPDTQNPQLPAGVLDLQEATLFIYDGVSAPATDEILLVTLMSNSSVPADTLSGGGPIYELVEAVTNTSQIYNGTVSGWFSVGAGYAPNQIDLSLTTGIPTGIGNRNNGEFWAQFAATNSPAYPFAAAVFNTITVPPGADSLRLDIDGDYVYRMQAQFASTNASRTNNPGMRVDIESRGGVGEAFGEFSQYNTVTTPTDAPKYQHGPVAGSPAVLKAFLWPRGDGTAEHLIAVWDIATNVQGSITVNNIVVERFEQSKLGTGTVLYDAGTGAASGFAVNPAFAVGTYGFAAAPLKQDTLPWPTINASTSPALTAAGTRNDLNITGTASAVRNNGGVGTWVGSNQFTSSADPKLVIVKAEVRTTSAETAKIPPFYLSVQEGDGNTRHGYMLDRKIKAGVKQNEATDLTNAATPVYLVFESLPSEAYGIEFYSVLIPDQDDNDTPYAGNLTIDRITVTEYDLPTERP